VYFQLERSLAPRAVAQLVLVRDDTYPETPIMAELNTPRPHPEKIKSVGDFLRINATWQTQNRPSEDEGFQGQLWYRGVNHYFPSQVPGVYRPDFTARAKRLRKNGDDEDKRLHLEREMLAQFRNAGATFLNRENLVEVYFAAQHFGMPTRLLDWSTNPLAALFFACDGQPDQDGVVYAMDARKIIPPEAMRTANDRLYQAVMTMRHPFVAYAIGISFWNKPKDDHRPHVLPVRPEIIPGRITQQSSCFTLHMHRAASAFNDTLITLSVEADRKGDITNELHRMNINQFTIYSDLDHLSKEIRRCWGLP
jgi:hypothetical protein